MQEQELGRGVQVGLVPVLDGDEGKSLVEDLGAIEDWSAVEHWSPIEDWIVELDAMAGLDRS
jgi:hypothetical protein